MLLKEEKNRRVGIFILVVLLSGLMGNLVGLLLGTIFPAGVLHDVLAREIEYGLNPPLSINLWLLSLSAGLLIRLNGCGLLFIFLGILLYKKA